MYRRDPILSSSPPPAGVRARSDSEDDLPGPHVTQPTQLLDTHSRYFPAPATTQPTLPLTPRLNRTLNPPSQVQVVRSSPATERYSSPAMSQSQSQRPLGNLMAPAGNVFFPPPPVRKPVYDLTSDDPPVEPDSEEELDGFYSSNIKLSKVELEPRTSRVEETPMKPVIDLSAFQYNAAIPRKRPADARIPNTLPYEKKAKPLPRQTAPSRAQPIDLTEDDMTLEDIVDFDLRRKVQRLQTIYPTKSIQQLYQALIKKKGHFDDASDYLAELSSDDELLQTPPEIAALKHEPKKTAQRVVNAPIMSLQEKYANARPTSALIYNTPSTTASPEQPKKKGRLMRGRRKRTPSPAPTPPRPHQRKDVITLSDDEQDEIDEGIRIPSDDESEAEGSIGDGHDEGDLLEFFNECTVKAMADLSGLKEEDIQMLFEHRPFASFAAIEKIHVDNQQQDKGKKKARKPKILFGQRLVDAAKDMWTAYGAIDEVVKACEAHGRPMVNGMTRWGVNICGGTTTDGEVAVTNLDDSGSDTTSTRDSGYHTPRSTNESDTETDVSRKATSQTSGKSKFLKKPSIMNDDIQLKDYQIVGLNWLNLLWQNSISGILADDMGLGKTCQVIAFLSHLKEKNEAGPHLVVVPGSTLENWLREFQHFCKKINFVPYYGSQDERFGLQFQILDGIEAGNIDVVVTTYDLAFKPQDNSFLRKCNPQACIFDEGHVLRNSNTQRYKSLMRINARCRLLLTGTPLQNSLQELTSILAFLMPEKFKDVEEHLAIVFKHKAKVNESDSHSSLLSTQRIQRARSMMTPFILRRKKAQVLKHLPKKTCRVEYCELTDLQQQLYNEQLDKQRQVLLDRAAGIQSREQTNIMMKLRQAAIHPLLFRHRYNDDKIRKMSKACLKEKTFADSNPDIIFEELQLYQDYQCHQLASKYPRALGKYEFKHKEWMDSGKVAKLVELLKKFKANGDRTLVFSQFTSVMDILQWVLDDLQIAYFRLDGQTPIKARQEMMDQFYADESIPVFMLSTKSGGAGINLACANKVVIFDSSFNPQDDIQAENRAHRVGQTREVEVVRLVTKGTVEEQIHALGASKLELDKMVSGEEGAEGGATTKKKDIGDSMSKAEEEGLEAVEQMMLEQLKQDQTADIKDQFMDGLKKAGLNMSAA